MQLFRQDRRCPDRNPEGVAHEFEPEVVLLEPHFATTPATIA
jgi:hypothetical protein